MQENMGNEQKPGVHPAQLLNLTTSKFSYSSYMVIKTIMQKIMYFQSKKHFHLTYWWSVLIFLFCVYVFVRVLFQFCHHETMNSFKFAYMHSFLFGLSSNHVVHNKRIHGHGLDFTICCCILESKETTFEVDITSIILSYLYHFTCQ